MLSQALVSLLLFLRPFELQAANHNLPQSGCARFLNFQGPGSSNPTPKVPTSPTPLPPLPPLPSPPTFDNATQSQKKTGKEDTKKLKGDSKSQVDLQASDQLKPSNNQTGLQNEQLNHILLSFDTNSDPNESKGLRKRSANPGFGPPASFGSGPSSTKNTNSSAKVEEKDPITSLLDGTTTPPTLNSSTKAEPASTIPKTAPTNTSIKADKPNEKLGNSIIPGEIPVGSNLTSDPKTPTNLPPSSNPEPVGSLGKVEKLDTKTPTKAGKLDLDLTSSASTPASDPGGSGLGSTESGLNSSTKLEPASSLPKTANASSKADKPSPKSTNATTQADLPAGPLGIDSTTDPKVAVPKTNVPISKPDTAGSPTKPIKADTKTPPGAGGKIDLELSTSASVPPSESGGSVIKANLSSPNPSPSTKPDLATSTKTNETVLDPGQATLNADPDPKKATNPVPKANSSSPIISGSELGVKSKPNSKSVKPQPALNQSETLSIKSNSSITKTGSPDPLMDKTDILQSGSTPSISKPGEKLKNVTTPASGPLNPKTSSSKSSASSPFRPSSDVLMMGDGPGICGDYSGDDDIGVCLWLGSDPIGSDVSKSGWLTSALVPQCGQEVVLSRSGDSKSKVTAKILDGCTFDMDSFESGCSQIYLTRKAFSAMNPTKEESDSGHLKDLVWDFKDRSKII